MVTVKVLRSRVPTSGVDDIRAELLRIAAWRPRIWVSGNGPASRTSVALTGAGRAALETYAAASRDLLAGL
jgi:hypothetical protein